MEENEQVVTLVIADGHSLFRQAVRAALATQPGVEIIAEAHDDLEAVAEVSRVRPHVALVDANLPRHDGVPATAQIVKQEPSCRVIVLAEDEDERVLIDAVESGASGFLTKECPLPVLVETVRRVAHGETLIPSHMLGPLLNRLIDRRRSRNEAVRVLVRLTRRENEVLGLLAEGADNEAIAQALVISPQTARTHIQNILGKLGVHSRLEAAAFVIRNGLLDDLVVAGS